MEVDTLITGGLVVTMNSERRVIERGAVAIHGDRIVLLGEVEEVESRVQSNRKINAIRKAILPGFIDTHAHAGHSLTKTIGASLPSQGWLKMIDNIYFRGTTPEFWHADGLLSSLERARFGITTAVMMLGSVPRTDRPDYGEAFVDGASQTGIRTIMTVGPPSPPWPKTFTHWDGDQPEHYQVSFEQCMEVTEELVRSLHGEAGGLIRLMVGPSRFSVPSSHDYFFSEDQIEVAYKQAYEIRELANRYGVYIHAHAMGEVIEYLHDHLSGILGPDVLLAHCVDLSERECEIIADLGVKVAHCPLARRSYTARCPVPELIDLDATVAVASDASAPDRNFDLFEAMRTAQRLQRVHFADASYLPTGKILETVTIDAAKAVGMEDEIGSLEVGKKADLILVDMWKPHMVPSFMPVWRLVHEAFGQDVTDVFVSGKPVILDSRFMTVEEDEILELAEREAYKMVKRANVQSLMGMPPGFWGKSRYPPQ